MTWNMPCPGDINLRNVREPVLISWIAPCCKQQRPMLGRKRVAGKDGRPTWRCAVCCKARKAQAAEPGT